VIPRLQVVDGVGQLLGPRRVRLLELLPFGGDFGNLCFGFEDARV
jgi:hypothetical protein